MKTSETIKSHASLASTRCGRAYGVARLTVVMGILAAGVLFGYAPTEGAKGDFRCTEDAASESICGPAPRSSPHVIATPELVELLQVDTPGRLVERPGAGTGNGFKDQSEGLPDSDGEPLGNSVSGTQIFNQAAGRVDLLMSLCVIWGERGANLRRFAMTAEISLKSKGEER